MSSSRRCLHLALATNILTAVGAAPHFERPNFPILSRWYPDGVQIALLPFGERALRHFMYLERPEGMALDDAEGFTALQHVRPVTVDDAPLVGVPEDWATVGHLYRGIEAGLEQLCDRYGESGVFIGPPRAQAVTSIFEWPELLAVTDLRSARTAIEIIVEQGEGARGDWIKSHFGKFVGILEDFLAMQAADPAFDPARPVEPAYVRLPGDVESGILIEDRRTARVADLCNAVYEVTLQVLARYYVHHGETPPRDRHAGEDREASDELDDAKARPGPDDASHWAIASGPHRRPDPRGGPSGILRAAPPRSGLEDLDGASRQHGRRCCRPGQRPAPGRPVGDRHHPELVLGRPAQAHPGARPGTRQLITLTCGLVPG